MPKSAIIIRGMPNELWLAFRKQCLDEGISASRKIRELIAAALNGKEKEDTK